MKTLELRKEIITDILKKCQMFSDYKTLTWSINEGLIDVIGDINFSKLHQLSKLPFKFGKVDGIFCCDGCGLITLEGCPEEVTEWFSCENNKLSTLDFFPKKIIDNCFVGGNPGNFTAKDVRKICDISGIVEI